MKWSRQFLSYSITGTDSIMLWTQGDGPWLSDKFLSHDVTRHYMLQCTREDATQQVKQSCHHISYYASLLQSRMYSTCAAIWHHRNSFQQTQIMGNTDVCRSSALEVQPLQDGLWNTIYGTTRALTAIQLVIYSWTHILTIISLCQDLVAIFFSTGWQKMGSAVPAWHSSFCMGFWGCRSHG
jgi:hypothetical protein